MVAMTEYTCSTTTFGGRDVELRGVLPPMNLRSRVISQAIPKKDCIFVGSCKNSGLLDSQDCPTHMRMSSEG